MKRRTYIFTLMMIMSTLLCHAQQDFFDKYADMEGVTSVYITKSMLNMFPKMSGNINGVNIGSKANRLNNIQVLSSEKVPIIEQLRKETKHLNTKKGYEELIRIQEDGEKTTIYFKEQKKGNNEFILIIDEKDEFTIISITGNLTMKEIQEIMNNDK